MAGKLDLVIRSNRALRANALAVFDRTFSIFVALQMLAAVVAFIGVLSALMSLQLERTREIGTLRSIGITRSQLSRLTLLETGLMGAIAGLIAMPTGLVLATILIYIINLRSFGWTLQDAVTTFPIYSCILGRTCFRVVGKYLSRVAHGTDAARRGVEN